MAQMVTVKKKLGADGRTRLTEVVYSPMKEGTVVESVVPVEIVGEAPVVKKTRAPRKVKK